MIRAIVGRKDHGPDETPQELRLRQERETKEKLAEQNRETASQRQAREFEERSHRRHQRLLKETPMEARSVR